MRQLVFEGVRRANWIDAAEPKLSSDHGALVRPTVVSTCDMDAIALSGLINFRSGTPLGHEGVGTVVDVGDEVTSMVPGDVVIIPWQISCGTCQRCLRGHDTHCTTVPPGSCYGWGPHVARWGGFLADQVEVPYADYMLVPLPFGMDPRRAVGLSDNITDAWRAVGPPLEITGGGRVLVVGADFDDGGSIGLYAAAFACDLGADEVVFASSNDRLRRLAATFGATTIDTTSDAASLGSFDVTVDTSGHAPGLDTALRATGPEGFSTCTAGAVHRGKPPALPVYEMYMNTVTFTTGWAHTRSLVDEPLAMLSEGGFDPTSIAEVHDFESAPDAFGERFTKLIFER